MNLSEHNFGLINFTKLDGAIIAEQVAQESAITQILFIPFVVSTLAFGIIVNALLILVLFRKRKRESSLNLMITQIAISDFFLSSAILFISVVTEAAKGLWILGRAMCTIYFGAVNIFEFFVSIAVTVTFITFLVNPQIRTAETKRLILFIWISAILLGLPIGYFTEFVVLDDTDESLGYCYLNMGVFSDFFSETTKVLLPLIAIIILGVYQVFSNRFIFAETRTNRMLKVLFVTYIALLTPYNIITTVNEYDRKYFSLSSLLIAYSILTIMFCYKPVVYIWFDNDLKYDFTEMIKHFALKKSADTSALYSNEINGEDLV